MKIELLGQRQTQLLPMMMAIAIQFEKMQLMLKSSRSLDKCARSSGEVNKNIDLYSIVELCVNEIASVCGMIVSSINGIVGDTK